MPKTIKHIVAFEGIDGSGKSTLSRMIVENLFNEGLSIALVKPYSSQVGFDAEPLRLGRKIDEWAKYIGRFHERASSDANVVYDRNILTFISEGLKNGTRGEEMLAPIRYWEPLPEVIFLCQVSPEIALKRIKIKDEFAEIDLLRRSQSAIGAAASLVEKELCVKIVSIDTFKRPGDSMSEVIKYLRTDLSLGKVSKTKVKH